MTASRRKERIATSVTLGFSRRCLSPPCPVRSASVVMESVSLQIQKSSADSIAAPAACAVTPCRAPVLAAVLELLDAQRSVLYARLHFWVHFARDAGTPLLTCGLQPRNQHQRL